MFNTQKFGGYLSQLRKNADMTQSELADRLNLTRQAISRYENGDSFPDISTLVLIADIFGVSLDHLIASGEPTRGEALILGNVAVGNQKAITASIADVVNLAPLLKPSVLGQLSASLKEKDIDISNIIRLAEYLNSDRVVALLENATFDTISDELLEKLMPLLDNHSKETILQNIVEGKMDWRLIKTLMPYAKYMSGQIEAAVLEGALPWETLKEMRDGLANVSMPKM